MNDAGPVRVGEELPLDALTTYLTSTAPEIGTVESVRQFRGGFSNLTYLLQTTTGEYVLRRPPHGVGKGVAHDMSREHRILAALTSRGVPVPRPLVLCEDESVIGASFYVMTRLAGEILRGMPTPPPEPRTMRLLSASFVDSLVAIHAVGPSDPAIAALGKADGYVARQISGWSKRWNEARTVDLPAMDALVAWIAANSPPPAVATLVHNDYKYDNLVVDPGDLSHIVGILDWEMAALGDPFFDVGTSLGYWVEAGDHPAFRSLGLGATALPGNFTRREVWERYAEKSGRGDRDPLFYYVFGLFKIAVIAQQIYFRFQKGLTTDARFGRLGDAVKLLALTAGSAIDRQSIAPR